MLIKFHSELSAPVPINSNEANLNLLQEFIMPRQKHNFVLKLSFRADRIHFQQVQLKVLWNYNQLLGQGQDLDTVLQTFEKSNDEQQHA